MLTQYVGEVPVAERDLPPSLVRLAEAKGSTKSHAEARRLVQPWRHHDDTAYLAPSALDVSDGPDLRLATALGRTPAGDVWHPTFFTGFAARPDVTAAGLLAVADVAASRYADLGLAKRLANLDPVVTASGDRLRFESFSACNGVYARFDLLPDGIDSGEVGFGTTNVDVNPPLRAALARSAAGEPLHLAVGSDELRGLDPRRLPHRAQGAAAGPLGARLRRDCPASRRATETGMELTGRAVATFLGEPAAHPAAPDATSICCPCGPVPRVVPAQVPGAVPLLRVAAARGRPPGRSASPPVSLCRWPSRARHRGASRCPAAP